MNHPNPIIVPNEVQSDASAERPRQSSRRRRRTTALNLTFGIVAIIWLAVMWAVIELMLLEIG